MVIFAMIVAIVIAIVVATVDVDEAAVRARLAKEYKVVQAYSQAMMQRVKDLVAAEPQ
jgi:outer membrane lipoprotein-sorting protein